MRMMAMATAMRHSAEFRSYKLHSIGERLSSLRYDALFNLVHHELSFWRGLKRITQANAPFPRPGVLLVLKAESTANIDASQNIP